MLSHPILFASEHLTPRPGSCAMYTCTFELPNSIPDRHENVFENISGVYLYATMVSALPLYITTINQSQVLRPYVRLGPRNFAVTILAILSFGLSLALLTVVADTIAYLQG